MVRSSMSVRFFTWWTENPSQRRTRLRRSSAQKVRKFPMWATSYTVGPQVYMRTLPGLQGLEGVHASGEGVVEVDHGAPKVRPTTGTRARRSALSLMRSSGRMAWGPSERAPAGSGWTSRRRPSAPETAAARAMGRTSRLCPVAWDGSTRTGRWVISFRRTTLARSRLLRRDGSKERMPRSQRITSEFPPREDVLGGQEEFLPGGRKAPLEEDGLPGPAEGLEEGEILHVAAAHLEYVGKLRHHGQVLPVQDLAHHEEAVTVGGRPVDLQAFPPEPLEGVGARPRLEGAAPQDLAPRGGDRRGAGLHLVGTFHGAGPRREEELFAAHGRPTHPDHGPRRVHLPGGVDELGGRWKGAGNAGQRLQLLRCQPGGVGGDHQDVPPGTRLAAVDDAAPGEIGLEGLPLRLCYAGFQDDDHAVSFRSPRVRIRYGSFKDRPVATPRA